MLPVVSDQVQQGICKCLEGVCFVSLEWGRKVLEPTNHRDRMNGSETHDQKSWNDEVQRLVLDVSLLYSARDRVELKIVRVVLLTYPNPGLPAVVSTSIHPLQRS